MPKKDPKVFGKPKSASKPPRPKVQKKRNATQDALDRYRNNTKSTASKTAATSASAKVVTMKMPVVLDSEWLVKMYKKNPDFVFQSITGLMNLKQGLCRKVLDYQKNRREELEKYSFGKDVWEEEDSGMDEGKAGTESPVKKKPTLMELIAEVDDKPEIKNQGDQKAEKYELLQSFVLTYDSKCKLQQGMEKMKLKAGAPDFWIILDAKFFAFAQAVLPLIDSGTLDTVKRNELCERATCLKYNTLAGYRDVWWFRCLSTKALNKKKKDWVGRETHTSRKKSLHEEVKKAIVDFVGTTTYKKRNGATKMMNLFIAIFPGFTSSPIYKAGQKQE